MKNQKWIRWICCILAVVMALGLIVLTVVSAFAAVARTGRITAENVSLRKGLDTDRTGRDTRKRAEVTVLGSSGR